MYIFTILVQIIVHIDEEIPPFVHFGLHNYFTAVISHFKPCIFVFFKTFYSTKASWRGYFLRFRSTKKSALPRPCLALDNPPELWYIHSCKSCDEDMHPR